ncbi:hypothetical protein QFC21_004356 [Naganishia friedmannii]|uniref:Uncharacterized protein n=1 Tax=Naganishia friedmannii TaxID=89922 RepID=A0ACC2VH57_9TREE|nr:hypothetical protein QFC21_004356 [Naganishia friedmannii]
MRLSFLISVLGALATILAHPSLAQGQVETQARSGSDLQVRQPLNAFHGTHRFVDSPIHAKRSSRKHRGTNANAPKKREGKRKVKKRSGTCVAKTTSTSSLASATIVSSSVAKSAGHSTQTPSPSSSVRKANSFSSALPSSTPVVQNGFVANSSTSIHAASVRSSSASVTPRSSSKAATTTSSSVPAATTSKSSSWTSPDTQGNGPFSGEITYYDLGTDGSAIGACGTNLVDSDKIAAASYDLFDNWPGATANPNTNPICGQYAKVSSGTASVIVQIQDRCPGCDKRHLDLSPSAFLKLADLSVGLMDVTWEWVATSSG